MLLVPLLFCIVGIIICAEAVIEEKREAKRMVVAMPADAPITTRVFLLLNIRVCEGMRI